MSTIDLLHCCTIDPVRRAESNLRRPDFRALNDAVAYFCKRLDGSDMRISEPFSSGTAGADRVNRERMGG